MNAIDATVHMFESQVDVLQQNGCRVNKTYLSVEMPQDIRDFVAIAADATGQIQSGFCAMDGRLYNGMVDDSWNRMKDARADDAAYRRWFDQHRARPGDLACQCVAAAAFAYRPLVSIVVPCYKSDRVYPVSYTHLFEDSSEICALPRLEVVKRKLPGVQGSLELLGHLNQELLIELGRQAHVVPHVRICLLYTSRCV